MCYLFFNCYVAPFLEIGKFVISFFTLIIAWKIFNNFDVRKSFLKEQLKIVCELSNELFSFGLPSTLVSGGIASNYPRFFNFFNQKGVASYEKIFITTMYIDEILPFIKYQHNILLPKPIADRIKDFDLTLYSPTKKEDMPQKYILILHTQYDKNEVNKIHYYGYMDYDKFYDLSILLVNEISNWLENYGTSKINFPVFMRKKTKKR
jgi:hypothetical protein